MTLTLHEHPFASYCWKALIALDELGIDFERHLVGDMEDREKLAEIWQMASIPVLVDDATGITIGDSTSIVDYVDGLGDERRLIPADPPAALQARLWDRLVDTYLSAPMQKIVGDSIREEGQRDAHGVEEAHANLERAYELFDSQVDADEGWLAGPDFGLADCAAAPSLHYTRVLHRWDEERLGNLTGYFNRLTTRPSVAKVIDDAREWRHVFPLPWPDYAE